MFKIGVSIVDGSKATNINIATVDPLKIPAGHAAWHQLMLQGLSEMLQQNTLILSSVHVLSSDFILGN